MLPDEEFYSQRENLIFEIEKDIKEINKIKSQIDFINKFIKDITVDLDPDFLITKTLRDKIFQLKQSKKLYESSKEVNEKRLKKIRNKLFNRLKDE